MRKYAVAVGTMKVTSDTPVSQETRELMLKVLREEFAGRKEDLGAGFELIFEVVKD